MPQADVQRRHAATSGYAPGKPAAYMKRLLRQLHYRVRPSRLNGDGPLATATSYATGSYIERPAPTGLAEVVELILDKGLVIDVFVRVALVGIEILTIDARIVVASVDTYLRFAEAADRLDLSRKEPRQLPEFLGDLSEQGTRKGTKGATKGVIEGGKEKVRQAIRGDDDEEGGRSDGRRPRPNRDRRKERE